MTEDFKSSFSTFSHVDFQRESIATTSSKGIPSLKPSNGLTRSTKVELSVGTNSMVALVVSSMVRAPGIMKILFGNRTVGLGGRKAGEATFKIALFI